MSSSTGTDISQCLQVLVPTLANVFKCHFKKIWLENCPTRLKPVLYRIYVDDTFLLFRATKHVEKSKKYLKKRHKNIAVTSEIEENYSLSFLDVKISREKNKNVTSVFRKHTVSGIFTNFESFIFKFYKCSLIDTLSYSRFSLCSNMEKFHEEIGTLKSVFKSSVYTKNFIDYELNIF